MSENNSKKADLDPADEALTDVGRLWDARNVAESDASFVEPAPSHLRLATSLTTLLLSADPKPIALTGPTGVGKTVLLRHALRKLLTQGWSVFEAGADDIVAGMIYVGMLESRVKSLISRLSGDPKMIWYMPKMDQGVAAGASTTNQRGVLDMLIRDLADGRLRLVGECDDAAWNMVQQRRPPLRGLFRTLTVEEITPAEVYPLAESIARHLGQRSDMSIPAAIVREAIDLSDQYLKDQAAPGGFARLITSSLTFAGSDPGDAPRVITRDHLLTTLTTLTGLSRIVLDDRQRLDPKLLRDHFSRAIMGQQEAVDVLVERVAMLKAGLTDSARPIGVFLFAGPTGTGKTEVVKSLSQFLFGSAERMVRIDMSELRAYGTESRIIGHAGRESDQESLTGRVRTQPFSVILLDEFEKANPSIWDLFLQVFDDGRLTDASGRLVDFRHTIIIMTSNIGAAAHQGSPIGFTTGNAVFSNAQVAQTMGTVFRPEFINRLDRVVVFQPLSRATMRVILKKELARVLQRRGFRDRPWAVEWADSAIEFLLDRGFSPDMGARPLRRAIEQHILAPLALTIAEARFPEGDQFLFVSHAGNAIQVEFVDPDAGDPHKSPPAGPRDRVGPPTRLLEPKQLLLDPLGYPDAVSFLATAVGKLTEVGRGADWIAERQRLLSAINAPNFWQVDGRTVTLSRFEQMDRLEALAASAGSLLERLDRPGRVDRKALRAVIQSLAQQLHVAQAGLADLNNGLTWEKSIEVLPDVARGSSTELALPWCRQLVTMYEQWALSRGFQWQSTWSKDESCRLSFSGPGVQRLLTNEIGLHVLERVVRTRQIERCTARVREVLPATAQNVPAIDMRSNHTASDDLPSAPEIDADRTVRRYRIGPAPSVRDLVSGWRTAMLDGVLAGEFDLH